MTALGAPGSYMRLNLLNLGDEKYFGGISSTNTALGVPGANASAPTYTISSPRTVQLSVGMDF